MNIPYEKNQKERVPFETYKARYREVDPELLSEVSGVPYDREKRLFSVTLMNKRYTISHPDFETVCLDGDGSYAPLLDNLETKILLVRYLLEGKRVASQGNFYAYADALGEPLQSGVPGKVREAPGLWLWFQPGQILSGHGEA